MAESTLLFDKAPYKNVIVLGQPFPDENGQKMSKSKGNAADPFEALDSTVPMPSDGISTLTQLHGFQTVSMVKQSRKDSVSLWEHFGTHMFYVLYAEIDQFDLTKYTLDYDKLSVMDKWLVIKT